MIEILVALVVLAIVAYVIHKYVEIDPGLKNIVMLVVVLIFLIFAVRQLGIVSF